jgi:hypothetical protein
MKKRRLPLVATCSYFFIEQKVNKEFGALLHERAVRMPRCVITASSLG